MPREYSTPRQRRPPASLTDRGSARKRAIAQALEDSPAAFFGIQTAATQRPGQKLLHPVGAFDQPVHFFDLLADHAEMTQKMFKALVKRVRSLLALGLGTEQAAKGARNA